MAGGPCPIGSRVGEQLKLFGWVGPGRESETLRAGGGEGEG